MYNRPFDTGDPMYHGEPNDAQATTLFRALVHWCVFYPERTVAEILQDIAQCNPASDTPLDRIEIERASDVFAGDIFGVRS